MKLSIVYKPHCGDRPWLVKREDGHYSQHAHMRTRKDAEKVRTLIDREKYPYCREYKTAIQRLLSEEEFKQLRKKPRYFNPQKGVR